MAHYSGLWSGCEGLMTPKYVSSLEPLKDFDFTVCPVSLSDKLEGQKQGRSAVWTDTCVSFFPTLHIHLQVLGPIQRLVLVFVFGVPQIQNCFLILILAMVAKHTVRERKIGKNPESCGS